MGAIVVRRVSVVSEIAAALASLVPGAMRRFVLGPAQQLHIGQRDSKLTMPRLPFRPVDLYLSADIVLTKPLTIPAGAQRDLQSAAELLVRSETPFTPDDLLLHVEAGKVDTVSGSVSCTVRMAPRSRVSEALKTHRVRIGRVRRMLIGSNEQHLPRIDFIAALIPRRRWSRWTIGLPLAALIFAGALSAQGEVQRRQERITSLEDLVATKLAAVRKASDELAARVASSSGADAVARTLDATLPSTFLALNAVRNALPERTELQKVDVRGTEVRLAIRSPNALEDARQFGGLLPNWSAAVEGAITADQTAALETAVILLKPDTDSTQ